jgi:predicted membrane protein
MDFIFGNIFWGIVIILFGTSMILKGFNINLPLVKVFFAIVIIMFGVRMLIGGGKPRIHRSKSNFSKSSSVLYSRDDQEYTMVFTSGDIDLSELQPDAKDMEVTVVFGSAKVILPSDLRFDIRTTAVLGGIILPKTGHYGISENKTSLNPDSTSSPIRIEATSVFGRIEFITKDRRGTIPKPETEEIKPEESF